MFGVIRLWRCVYILTFYVNVKFFVAVFCYSRECNQWSCWYIFFFSVSLVGDLLPILPKGRSFPFDSFYPLFWIVTKNVSNKHSRGKKNERAWQKETDSVRFLGPREFSSTEHIYDYFDIHKKQNRMQSATITFVVFWFKVWIPIASECITVNTFIWI